VFWLLDMQCPFWPVAVAVPVRIFLSQALAVIPANFSKKHEIIFRAFFIFPQNFA
jgi:hypothetical protein